MGLVLAILTGIGARPPSKKTKAIPRLERPFEGLVRHRIGERFLRQRAA
jgi:hypothetical protein